MKITIKRVETKTVSEQWILRKLMWDGSPEPPDTEIDQAINGEDVISLIESDEDLKGSVQRYARSALEARVAELTAENERLVKQYQECLDVNEVECEVQRDASCTVISRLTRERADVDALLVAAEERLATVERIAESRLTELNETTEERNVAEERLVEVKRERDEEKQKARDTWAAYCGAEAQLKASQERERIIQQHRESACAELATVKRELAEAHSECEGAATLMGDLMAVRKRLAEVERERDGLTARHNAWIAQEQAKTAMACSDRDSLRAQVEAMRLLLERIVRYAHEAPTFTALSRVLDDAKAMVDAYRSATASPAETAEKPSFDAAACSAGVDRFIAEMKGEPSRSDVDRTLIASASTLNDRRPLPPDVLVCACDDDGKPITAHREVGEARAARSVKAPPCIDENGETLVGYVGHPRGERSRPELPAVLPHETVTCPECGPGIRIDEDGCCATCGVDATVEPSRSDDGKADDESMLDAMTREIREPHDEQREIRASLPPGPGTVVKRVRAMAEDYKATTLLDLWLKSDPEHHALGWNGSEWQATIYGVNYRQHHAPTKEALARAMGLVKGST